MPTVLAFNEKAITCLTYLLRDLRSRTFRRFTWSRGPRNGSQEHRTRGVLYGVLRAESFALPEHVGGSNSTQRCPRCCTFDRHAANAVLDAFDSSLGRGKSVVMLMIHWFKMLDRDGDTDQWPGLGCQWQQNSFSGYINQPESPFVSGSPPSLKTQSGRPADLVVTRHPQDENLAVDRLLNPGLCYSRACQDRQRFGREDVSFSSLFCGTLASGTCLVRAHA